MAKMDTLQDAFTGTSLNAQWGTEGYDQTQITVGSGHLTIAHNNTAQGNWNSIQSVSTFDLTASYAQVEVTDYGNQTLSGHGVILRVRLDDPNVYYFIAQNNILSCVKFVADAGSGADISLDIIAHRFLRIREAAGTIFWDASSNGVDWVNLRSVAAQFAVTAVSALLACGNSSAQAASQAVFDNFNVPLNVNPMSALRDDFSGTTLNARWGTEGYDQSQITVGSGHLTIAHNNTAQGNWNNIQSVSTFDLTGSFAQVEVTDFGNQTLSGHGVVLRVRLNDANHYYFVAQNSTLDCAKFVADVGTGLGIPIPLDTVAHRFLRIREQSGVIYWETSPNGAVGNWTTRRSFAVEFAITALFGVLACGNSSAQAASQAVFDNFNVPFIANIVAVKKKATASFTGSRSQAGTLGATMRKATASSTGIMVQGGILGAIVRKAYATVVGFQSDISFGIIGHRFYLYLDAVLQDTSPIIAEGLGYTFSGLISDTGYTITATNVDAAGNESVETVTYSAPTLAIPASGGELSAPDKTAVDAIVAAAMADFDQPGVSISITSPKGYYHKSYGVADGLSRALTLDDHFRMGGVTKTFTATAVLRLIDSNNLALTDTLEQYVSGVDQGDAITIEHMLTMRSGVYDYTASNAVKLRLSEYPQSPWSEDAALTIIRDNPSQSAPGSVYQYTDSNYVLLGAVVEAITGRNIRDIFNEDMITPLELVETSWPIDPDDKTNFILPDPAASTSELNPELFGAAGALVTTIADLHKWGEELRDGTLLNPVTQGLRKTTFELIPYNPGRASEGPTMYGYGRGLLRIGSWYGHDSSIPGFGCAVMIEPSTDSVIVVMENTQTEQSQALSRIWYRIANYLYPTSADFVGYFTDKNVATQSIPSGEVFGSPTLIALPPGYANLRSIPSAERFGTLTRKVFNVAFDNASAIGTGADAIPAFVIAADAKVVVAWVVAKVASIPTAATATLGGRQMTKTVVSSGSYHLVSFTLLNPPTGSQSIQLSGFGGWLSSYGTAAASYKNVTRLGTPVTGFGAADFATVSGSAAVSQMIVNGFMFNGALSSYNQTLRGSRNTTAFVSEGILFGDAPGAATVNFTADFTSGLLGNTPWRAIAIPLLND